MSFLYPHAAHPREAMTPTRGETYPPARTHRADVRPDDRSHNTDRTFGNPDTARMVDPRSHLHPYARIARLALGTRTSPRTVPLELLLRRLPVRPHHLAIDMAAGRAPRLHLLASRSRVAGGAVLARLRQLAAQRAQVRRRSVAGLEQGVRASVRGDHA